MDRVWSRCKTQAEYEKSTSMCRVAYMIFLRVCAFVVCIYVSARCMRMCVCVRVHVCVVCTSTYMQVCACEDMQTTLWYRYLCACV